MDQINKIMAEDLAASTAAVDDDDIDDVDAAGSPGAAAKKWNASASLGMSTNSDKSKTASGEGSVDAATSDKSDKSDPAAEVCACIFRVPVGTLWRCCHATCKCLQSCSKFGQLDILRTSFDFHLCRRTSVCAVLW